MKFKKDVINHGDVYKVCLLNKRGIIIDNTPLLITEGLLIKLERLLDYSLFGNMPSEHLYGIINNLMK